MSRFGIDPTDDEDPGNAPRGYGGLALAPMIAEGDEALIAQLEASIARAEVLREMCVPAASLPSPLVLESIHEQLDELLHQWRFRWLLKRS